MAATDEKVAEDSQSVLDMPRHTSKKRKLSAGSAQHTGVSATPISLRQPDLPEFNLTSASRPSQDSVSPKDGNEDPKSSREWQTVEPRSKKTKKIPKTHSSNYPAIEFSKDSRLQSQIKISDLQSLVLYILADGPSPQFVSVRHRPEIRKLVVLMVPGLERDMFETKQKMKKEDGARSRNYTSPDDYFPIQLHSDDLPESLKSFADMFKHIWPVKTPGDEKYGKMHSPMHAMLTAPLPKTKEEKTWSKNRKGATPAKEPHGWKNNRTRISEFVHLPEELLESEYVLHPASCSDKAERAGLIESRRSNGVSKEHGWVDTLVDHLDDGTVPDNEIEAGSLTAGREILAMDCEMCMTGENEFSLTRISLVGWDGSVVLDELVKPEKPITNYVTQYASLPFFLGDIINLR